MCSIFLIPIKNTKVPSSFASASKSGKSSSLFPWPVITWNDEAIPCELPDPSICHTDTADVTLGLPQSQYLDHINEGLLHRLAQRQRVTTL